MQSTFLSALVAILLVSISCAQVAAATCPPTADQKKMKKLYEYALIAEAPKRSNFMYMKDCKADDGTVKAEKPDAIVDIQVPMEFTKLVENRVDNSRLRIRPTRRNDNDELSAFSVGCAAERDNESILVEIGFKLLASVTSDGVFFYLTGTEVKGGIIRRDNGELIVVSPGTNPTQLAEIRANFSGEKCVFPFVRETVKVLCEVIQSRGESKDDAILSVRRAFVEANREEYFTAQTNKFTMIGHSLGGTATQFVAQNPPKHCLPDGNIGKFFTYAFASPGLERQSIVSGPSNSHNVYLINGDWFLTTPFSEKFQSGQISIFSFQDMEQSCPGHFIDEVQNTICGCLKGQGAIRNVNGNRKNSDILSEDLCSADTSDDHS